MIFNKAQKADKEECRADDYVEAVESGGDEEGGAVYSVGDGEGGLVVFHCLEGGEVEA